jgi:hypothetical protein
LWGESCNPNISDAGVLNGAERYGVCSSIAQQEAINDGEDGAEHPAV